MYARHVPRHRDLFFGTPAFSNQRCSSRTSLSDVPAELVRKQVKKGLQLTVMVVGSSGLGKTTFLNSLFPFPIMPRKNFSEVVKAIKPEKTMEVTAIPIGSCLA